jgi:hypothetical protein
VVVELVSQVGLNAATTAVEQFAHSVPRDATDEGSRQQQEHGNLHLAKAGVAPKCVNALLEKPGTQGGEEVGDYDESQANQIGPAVRLEVGK